VDRRQPADIPPPESPESWASRSLLGEKYWSGRKGVPVPAQHRVAPTVLGAISAFQTLGKLWFLDRMALLYNSCAGSADRPE
jgi:hypothetical protein